MASRFAFGSRRGAESTSQQIYETARRNGVSTPAGIGGVLRERREAMGVTLAEAEIATRIRQKYLAALESDEWQLLPGEVVGRGFLRNYSTYLGLEPTEIIERRRAITDPNLSVQLASTSAGSNLPAVRQVDYRPKEVDLRDEPDVMETRELRLAPIFATLGVLALAALLWFGRDTLGTAATGIVDAAQAGVAELMPQTAAPSVPSAAPAVEAGVVNPQNLGEDGALAAEAAAVPPGQVAQAAGTGDAVVNQPADNSTNSDTASSAAGSVESEPAEQVASTPVAGGALAALIPTPTPNPDGVPAENAAAQDEGAAETSAAEATPAEAVPVEPTPAPAEPTPTPAPAEPTATPTEEPTPEEVVAAVAPPACADVRSAITSPGVGQVVAGLVGVTGTATHEAFGYYKLEFAPGANAGGGFVYFAGAQNPVAGGLLGSLDTTALGNGDYTLQLTVVDQTGNFPPPCQVTVTVQN